MAVPLPFYAKPPPALSVSAQALRYTGRVIRPHPLGRPVGKTVSNPFVPNNPSIQDWVGGVVGDAMTFTSYGIRFLRAGQYMVSFIQRLSSLMSPWSINHLIQLRNILHFIPTGETPADFSVFRNLATPRPEYLPGYGWDSGDNDAWMGSDTDWNTVVIAVDDQHLIGAPHELCVVPEMTTTHWTLDELGAALAPIVADDGSGSLLRDGSPFNCSDEGTLLVTPVEFFSAPFVNGPRPLIVAHFPDFLPLETLSRPADTMRDPGPLGASVPGKAVSMTTLGAPRPTAVSALSVRPPPDPKGPPIPSFRPSQ